MLYLIRTWDYASSTPEERAGDYAFAYRLANRGGYYKVQAIDCDLDTVTHEWSRIPGGVVRTD